MGLSTISRAKRDQTWREDVVTNGIGRVEGITVDWIAGLVITNSASGSDALFRTSTRCWVLFCLLLQEIFTGLIRALMWLKWPGWTAPSDMLSFPRGWTSPEPSRSTQLKGKWLLLLYLSSVASFMPTTHGEERLLKDWCLTACHIERQAVTSQ